MATSVSELAEKYKKFVKEHPENVRQFESAVRIMSYLIPGRFDDSNVLSELMYSASNLLVLMNDVLLRQAYNIKYKVALSHNRLLGYLTVLDYTEVFLELVARRLGGELARWVIIVCIQITKAAIRCLLLLKNKSGVQSSPPIPPLNREKELKNKITMLTSEINGPNGFIQSGFQDPEAKVTEEDTAVTFTLKRSGRVVRSLAAAPPMMHRSWKPPSGSTERRTYLATQLSSKQIWGEGLHIARPLLHLSSLYVFGEHSWKPWLVAGGVDISSLCLMGDPSELNPVERAELRRRLLILLLYLLRSPFYDKFSRARLISALQLLGSTVPGTNLIIKPMLEYLPTWQRIYAYVWAS